MEIGEIKQRVVDECSLMCGGLPFDVNDLDMHDWESLSQELAECAKHIRRSLSRVAGYAGHAKRMAQRE